MNFFLKKEVHVSLFGLFKKNACTVFEQQIKDN